MFESTENVYIVIISSLLTFLVLFVVLILFKLNQLIERIDDLNIKVGRIGIRQITSSVRFEDGTVKVSTDTTGEVNEIIRLLRDIRDGSNAPKAHLS